MKPYMRDDEIRAINSLLDRLGTDLVVLEYGSGGSTLAFACHDHVKRWVSIESDSNWFYKVQRKLNEGKNHKVREKISLRYGPDLEQFVITAPGETKYDLVFVDGIKWRNECLMTAPTLLAPGGVVLLHDCDRVNYSAAVATYSEQQRISAGNPRHQGLMVLRPEQSDGITDLESMSFSDLRELANGINAPLKRSRAEQIQSILETRENEDKSAALTSESDE